MLPGFDELAERVDEEVAGMPTVGEWVEEREAGGEPLRTLKEYCNLLVEILELLGAENPRYFFRHFDAYDIRFHSTASPYFRLGPFGRNHDVQISQELEGCITVGFYDEMDWPSTYFQEGEMDGKPKLTYWYNWEDDCTDFGLDNVAGWLKVLNEFFDMRRVTDRYKF